jgi:hypothetical protein
MKKIILLFTVCAVLVACSDNKKQEKALMDSVMAVHEKVMGSDDQLMRNKMRIDTLLKQPLTGDTVTIKRQLMGLKVQLTTAEDAMSMWMQKFDPEMKGKSHEDIMNYLGAQKAQIITINGSIDSAISSSTRYLKILNK